ncbi:outer membrane transport energization protein ExbD [Sphingobacterium alimentarium]|uniref:Outer membrane transport energization protein ExbD n=1 Tax=Sphingobacterium alimentarium TaxID=797292 RepID=A0A4R3VV87_9SPHI|nr:biopolymer transporter ExbD [Sphingobacterium alimentarium]TCV18916.1 outer membrane transport energization protein ExbD [Sphingobacterium alimentarium]
MGKAKVKRASTSIDMTAMCDVSFLLLTFFVLTATARQPETLTVDTAPSYSQAKLPDGNLAIITVGDEGKVFFKMSDPNVRVETLQRMASKYGMEFSPEEYAKFKGLEDFGVSIKAMKTLLAANDSERTAEKQRGIPVDSTQNLTNELFSWVKEARVASANILRNKAMEDGKDPDDIELMTVAIKADADEKFPSLNLIIETLRNQKQNKFSFVTGLKAD